MDQWSVFIHFSWLTCVPMIWLINWLVTRRFFTLWEIKWCIKLGKNCFNLQVHLLHTLITHKRFIVLAFSIAISNKTCTQKCFKSVHCRSLPWIFFDCEYKEGRVYIHPQKMLIKHAQFCSKIILLAKFIKMILLAKLPTPQPSLVYIESKRFNIRGSRVH